MSIRVSPKRRLQEIASAIQTFTLLGTAPPDTTISISFDVPLFDGAGRISSEQPESVRREIDRLSMTSKEAVTTVRSPFDFASVANKTRS